MNNKMNRRGFFGACAASVVGATLPEKPKEQVTKKVEYERLGEYAYLSFTITGTGATDNECFASTPIFYAQYPQDD